MPPFLLHEILPKIDGPWLLLILLLVLLWFVVTNGIVALAVLGALVVARGDRIAFLPDSVREAVRSGPRPSIRLCLVVLALCVIAGALTAHDSGFVALLTVLTPLPFAPARSLGMDEGMGLLFLSIAAAGYWVLIVTGARAALPMVRRWRTARADGGAPAPRGMNVRPDRERP
jgi:hypothetical protein